MKHFLGPDRSLLQRLPKKFVEDYGHTLPGTVLLESPDGHVWEVEVTRPNGKLWLEKGFEKFREYYSLEFGYFLTFKYDGKLSFHVGIFDASGSEIEYPLTVKQTREKEKKVGSDDAVEGLGKVPTMGKPSKQNVESPLQEDIVIEVLDDFSRKQNVVNRKRRERGDDGFKIQGGSSRKQPENKKKAARSYYEDRKVARSNAVSSSQRSKSTQNKVVRVGRKLHLKPVTKRGEFCSTRQHLPHPNSGSKQTVLEKERALAYQKAKAFKSKNPFFISFMQPSYISFGKLTIPKTFVQNHLSGEKHCHVELHVPDGKMWKVRCYTVRNNAKLYWKEFGQQNGLQVGDACVFERRNDSSCPVLNVIIFRTSEYLKGTLDGNVISEREESIEVLDDHLPKQETNRNRPDIEDDVSIEILDGPPVYETTNQQSKSIHSKRAKHERTGLEEVVPPRSKQAIKKESSTGWHSQPPASRSTVRVKKVLLAHEKAEAFKSSYPFFIPVMRHSYLAHPFYLYVKSPFARKYLANLEDHHVMLHVEGGLKWKVRCYMGRNICMIYWKEFVLHNNLQVDDACVFEWRNDSYFNVIIYRNHSD